MKFSLSYFIARRLSYQKGSGSSQLIVRIAMGAVALSIAVMIVAIAIVKGYQSEIRSKIIGFSTHIQITNLDMNNSFETNPIYRDAALEKMIRQQPTVTHLQPFAIKAGILKTKEDFTGVVLKGVDSAFDWQFLQQHIVEGNILQFDTGQTSTGLFISKILADKLNLKLHDAVLLYIAQQPPRVRKFKVTGIFHTGLAEMDELYAFADIRQVQKLNNWNDKAISGYEVGITDYKQLDRIASEILVQLPYYLQIHTIRDMFPQLFDWLGLLDLNVWVIIALMVVVACINMITALLILIIERSNMIGMLKAMGANNRVIGMVFIYMAGYLLLLGMILGNLVGIGLCLSQSYFGWLKLSQEAYYLSEVPIQLEWQDILLVNGGSFLVCIVVLLLPARFVSRITPIKSIRFE